MIPVIIFLDSSVAKQRAKAYININLPGSPHLPMVVRLQTFPLSPFNRDILDYKEKEHDHMTCL